MKTIEAFKEKMKIFIEEKTNNKLGERSINLLKFAKKKVDI